MHPWLVYERTLKGPKQLLAELEGLEVDSGIRMSGRVDGSKRLLFVTRVSGVFTLWIREGQSKGEFRKFKSAKSLFSFLVSVTDKPIVAKVY